MKATIPSLHLSPRNLDPHHGACNEMVSTEQGIFGIQDLCSVEHCDVVLK